MESIFLVSAGMLNPKKKDTTISRRHYYLNYGLLNIASKLYAAGINSKVIHGLFKSPEAVINRIKNIGYNGNQYPLLISFPSFYSVPWGAHFCKLIKKTSPNQIIIAGGRWVVNNRIDYIYSKIPELDLVVCGTAEDCVVHLVTAARKKKTSFPVTKKQNKYYICDSDTPSNFLEYSLLDQAHKFNPSIEVSRGCGMGCNFCEERNIKLKPIQNPKYIVNHLEYVSKFYGTDILNTYLEASNFLPTTKWAKELYLQKKATGLRTRWRCESRVDTIRPKTLYYLSKSGLKVMDIGLESASPIQLQRMGKTKYSNNYLSKASGLLNTLSDLGIWAKINILLYAGETNDTVNETIEWLDCRSHQIKGVSVGPLILFGLNGESTFKYIDLEHFGAKILEQKDDCIEGITKINLSKEISFSEADDICQKISKMFMSAKDYYDLKSFSYFDRNYTYSEFTSDVIKSDINLLPFSV